MDVLLRTLRAFFFVANLSCQLQDLLNAIAIDCLMLNMQFVTPVLFTLEKLKPLFPCCFSPLVQILFSLTLCAVPHPLKLNTC